VRASSSICPQPHPTSALQANTRGFVDLPATTTTPSAHAHEQNLISTIDSVGEGEERYVTRIDP
jgi:hypothetical protein